MSRGLLYDLHGEARDTSSYTLAAGMLQTAFKLFGDRVKYWSTINEPVVICIQGWSGANMPPGRCSDRSRCEEGDSSTEPGLCYHNILLAHAAVSALLTVCLHSTSPALPTSSHTCRCDRLLKPAQGRARALPLPV